MKRTLPLVSTIHVSRSTALAAVERAGVEPNGTQAEAQASVREPVASCLIRIVPDAPGLALVGALSVRLPPSVRTKCAPADRSTATVAASVSATRTAASATDFAVRNLASLDIPGGRQRGEIVVQARNSRGVGRDRSSLPGRRAPRRQARLFLVERCDLPDDFRLLALGQDAVSLNGHDPCQSRRRICRRRA